MPPETFDGVQFGTVSGQPENHDAHGALDLCLFL
jgi:hypothetical protein